MIAYLKRFVKGFWKIPAHPLQARILLDGHGHLAALGAGSLDLNDVIQLEDALGVQTVIHGQGVDADGEGHIGGLVGADGAMMSLEGHGGGHHARAEHGDQASVGCAVGDGGVCPSHACQLGLVVGDGHGIGGLLGKAAVGGDGQKALGEQLDLFNGIRLGARSLGAGHGGVGGLDEVIVGLLVGKNTHGHFLGRGHGSGGGVPSHLLGQISVDRIEQGCGHLVALGYDGYANGLHGWFHSLFLSGWFHLITGLGEEVHESHDENNDDDHRDGDGKYPAHPGADLQSLARIGLGHEALPAPSVTGRAEKGKYKRTQGQEDVADGEVLQIQNGGALSEGSKGRPDIVAEHAGQREEQHAHADHDAGSHALPAREIHEAGDDVLEDGQHGGQGGEGHEHEEQRAPQTTHGHVVEDVGKGLEDQGRACSGIHAVGKASGENDQTRGKGHEGIQHGNVDGLAQESALLTDVATEDRHGSDTQAQGEEGLVHGRHDDVEDTCILEVFNIGHQVELQSFRAALQEQAVHGQYSHENKKGHHHNLGDALETLLHAQHTHADTDDHGQGHENSLPGGVSQHSAEFCFDLRGGHTIKGARSGLDEVVHHPARHVVVEHHENDAAHQADDTVEVPLGLGRLQLAEHDRGGFLGGATHGELHGHNGNTQHHQAGDIDQYEDGAAVLAHHPGEFPHIADADGTACGEENEAEAASETITRHKMVPFGGMLRFVCLVLCAGAADIGRACTGTGNGRRADMGHGQADGDGHATEVHADESGTHVHARMGLNRFHGHGVGHSLPYGGGKGAPCFGSGLDPNGIVAVFLGGGALHNQASVEMLTALDGEADPQLGQHGQNRITERQGGLHGGVLADTLSHHLGGGAADHKKLPRGEVGGFDQLSNSGLGITGNIQIQLF